MGKTTEHGKTTATNIGNAIENIAKTHKPRG